MDEIKEICEICGYNNHKIILNKGKIGKFGEYGKLEIIQCQKCGHVVKADRRSYEEDKEFFKNTYHSLNTQTLDDEELIKSQIKRSEGIVRYLSSKFPENKNLLDLGCGHGYVMQNFMSKGYKCSGIDPDKLTVDYAQNKGSLDIKLGSAEELPYPDESFDVLISLGTLEHVSNIKMAFAEIRRVLSKDGILFLRMRPNRIWGLPFEYFNISTNRYFSLNTHLLALYLNGFDSHLITDEQLEGRNGDIYITVKKSNKEIQDVDTLLKKGYLDKPGELKNYLKMHYKKITKQAKELIKCVGSDNENLDLISNQIDSGEYSYPLFTGYSDTKKALIRAVREAKIILSNPFE